MNSPIRYLRLLAPLVVIAFAFVACDDASTSTASPATATATAAPTLTTTPTPSPTVTVTATVTESPTSTETTSSTTTPTATATATASATETAIASPTETATASATPTATVTSTSGFPLTIEQADGQSLVLVAPPARIVSLSAYATATLCAVGAGDQLAAVDMYANCPEGSKEKPELDAFQPSLEGIASYEPDLVYVDTDTGGIVAALRGLDIPVLYLTLPATIDETLDRIDLFGQVSGHAEEGSALVEDMQAKIDEMVAEIPNGEGPRVFHELDETLFSVGPGSFIDDFYTVLGAQNIADDPSNPYPQLTAEAVIAADPEVIVLADEAFGVTVDSVKARPGWDVITAVKEDRICPVDPNLLSQPGPQVVDALEALAICLYPETFQ